MVSPLLFNKRAVGQDRPAYVVAEIGINHNGDVHLAKQLIDAAFEAGCDAVKFQKRTPEIWLPARFWNVERETLWGTYVIWAHILRGETNVARKHQSEAKARKKLMRNLLSIAFPRGGCLPIRYCSIP